MSATDQAYPDVLWFARAGEVGYYINRRYAPEDS